MHSFLPFQALSAPLVSVRRLRMWGGPVAVALLALGLAGCSTAPGTGQAGAGRTGQRLDLNHPAVLARRAEIAAEPRGDVYIGRRFWLEGTRFWGFVRKPGQPWEEAKLVMLGEKVKKAPDRLPEANGIGSKAHGFDHNYEYKLKGYLSGERVYDPNSNLILPEFVLQDYELLSKNPGFLFHPQQRFEPKRIPEPPRY